ncbi:MAG: hypothetical protein HZC37_23065 [Burkholderiales bacterium]|nr:hypothetical protein [Burkholderiales bacterium]
MNTAHQPLIRPWIAGSNLLLRAECHFTRRASAADGPFALDALRQRRRQTAAKKPSVWC